MIKHLLFIVLIFSLNLSAQLTTESFNSTRILNGHSNETLKKRQLEYRIEHRFGDLAGKFGGPQNGFGFDNASDIRFALEYGLTDKFMIGLGRSKGNILAYRNVIDLIVKYKLLCQNEKNVPISITFTSLVTNSYAKKSTDINSISYFPEYLHRIAYANQFIITRKFSPRISLAIIPSLVHRNYVLAFDKNTTFSVGTGLNLKITKSFGLLAEYYHNFSSRSSATPFRNPLAFGLEWATNGHCFHISISNSSLFNETQFIPVTREAWSLGQYRIGFSISRTFKT